VIRGRGALMHDSLARLISANTLAKPSPLLVGLCGPQGSGKSTLALALKSRLEGLGLSTAVLSLDDLYLTRSERLTLAQRVHPLLQTRGVPGTHDVALGLEVLDALTLDGVTELPSFDKARDDRRPRSQWLQVRGPLHVIVFEGWCVGARPQPEAALAAPVNALERDLDRQGIWRRYVNEALAHEYRTLFDRVSFLVLLKPPSFDVVYGWRLEQEHELRRRTALQGGDLSRVMSDEAVRHFIDHYERLTRHVLEAMPTYADLVIELDRDRTARIR
jgi:D-glycerate 3-kinase